jgi:Phage T7 tail fibre protein.
MTVSSEQSSVTYAGDNVTVLFPIPYYFLEKTHITVSLVSSTGVVIPKVLDVDYTVSGAGNQAGGSLTFTVAPPDLSTLQILREVPVTQLTDYQPNDDFPAESHERALDKLTMIAQQLVEDNDRALRHPVDSEHYQAEARRIVNMEDPVDQQDAVTKNAMEVYVGEVITAGTGPMNLAQNVIYIDPYGIPRVVQDMSGPAGAVLNGFKQLGTNTAQRDVYRKIQREIELDDYLTGGADDTVQFQNMLNDIPSKTTRRLITIGGLQSSFSGTTPRVIVRAGDYSISDALVLPPYLNLEGEECLITQTGGVTKDIFFGEAYLWTIQGFNMAGGRNQINFYNNNTNSAMVEIMNCDLQLADGFGINTFATGNGPGGAWAHLSTECNIHKVRILSCKQAIKNVCDHMSISQSWIQADKSNIVASTAQIINRGTSATDPDALTRLHIKDTFMIPNVGALGVDRVAGVRWVDNYGSFNASHTRFGGESGGMQIVAQLGAPNTTFPWNSQEVGFFSCFLFAGPDGAADSCVMAIQGQLPNRFVMRDCTGPLSSPIIANLSSLNIPAYMTAFEAASGRKAYEYFKVQIDNVNHDLNAYTPLRPLMPSTLLPYTLKGRSTKVRKQTQSLANAFAVNLVSFATIVDDNIGAFAIANPTRLVMPNGCSKMSITVFVAMAVDGAAKTISVDLVDSGGTLIEGETSQKGINPDTDRIKCTFKASGPPGTYWQIRIRHNAAAALNLIDCQVDLTPTDFQG